MNLFKAKWVKIYFNKLHRLIDFEETINLDYYLDKSEKIEENRAFNDGHIEATYPIKWNKYQSFLWVTCGYCYCLDSDVMRLLD